MTKYLHIGIFLLLLLFGSCAVAEKEKDLSLRLWYEWEAERFLEALPVGNGHMGAMIYGGVEKDMIGLHNATFWSGEASDAHDNQGALSHISSIRELMFAGDYEKAAGLCREHMLGHKENYGTHLPMGSLYLDFGPGHGPVEEYVRELDLQKALAKVSYVQDGVPYEREYLCSHPDRCLAIRLKAGREGSLDFYLSTEWDDPEAIYMPVDENTLSIKGEARENRHSDGQCGVAFETRIRIQSPDGKVEVLEDGIRLEGADEAVIFVVSATDFEGGDPAKICQEQLNRLAGRTYAQIRSVHEADHAELFERLSLQLGGESESDRPIDERLASLVEGAPDPDLYALFYQYGRYLLIASSREDSPLPANLQGLWNDNFACRMPWTCDFHLDINSQQNYWIAESANLSECHSPLFRLIEGMVEPGQRTARSMYGAPGWVAHVVTNARGFTSPGWGMGWALHVSGGIWIASHLWHHYEYTGDPAFLEDVAYPVLKGAAEFFSAYMVEDPVSGWLVTGPSLSPENAFYSEDGFRVAETMGPTCDAVLIRDLYQQVIKASEILGQDEAFREKLRAELDLLPPLQVGKYGQIMEWLKDYEEAVPNHRHTSHLIALYPSAQITPAATPELAAAARMSIDRRLGQPDWEDVEWSRGNLINFFARLGEGEKALEHLHGLLAEDTDKNMMTFSRAGIAGAQENIWVMDGNTSGANGISEMLLQSYGDTLYILPALPAAWKEGEIKGLRVRGGFEIEMEWTEGELTELKLVSLLGEKLNLKYGRLHFSTHTDAMKEYTLNKNLKLN